MSLPKGYKRLEYIQADGASYIDSNFAPNQDTRVYAECELPISASSNQGLFGSRVSSSSSAFQFVTQGGYYRSDYNGTLTTISSSDYGTAKFYVDKNKNATDLNGQYSAEATYAAFSCPHSMYIFATNNNGALYDQSSAKLYVMKIYDNGTLVRDFIPCQNASGAVGLWDAVNEEFYGNAGAGTFTAGPVVPEIVDENEITELEHIQSNGTQYADTGFIPNQNTRLVLDGYNDSASSGWTYGTWESATVNQFAGSCNKSYAVRYGTTNATLTENIPVGPVNFDQNKNAYNVNGTTGFFTAQTFSCQYSIFLFAINAAGAVSSGKFTGKIYSCQIYDNGLLERDYIPAKLSNGEVGLYDRVFHEFYRNAGTGEFIAGPEMVHEGYTELEYIQSSGAQHVDTLFYPTGATQLTLDFQMINQGTEQQGIFGSRPGSSGRFTVFTGTSAARLQVDYNTQFGLADSEVNISGLNVNQRTLLEVSNRLIVNGAKINEVAAASFTSAYTLFLFANNNAGAVQLPGAMILYACQIYDNGVAVRIYVPMLHPSGVAGLWDSVNERFYASSTTTDLIAGPEAQTVPKSPANFRVESETDTLVTLAWDASDKAVGYRLYRSGQLLADTTETSVSVTVEPFAGAVFTVTAYNENGEGAGTSLTYMSVPEDPILYLITDRTQADVTERNSKGYYAASDLNRVGYAVEYLAGRLKDSGVSVTVSPVLTWTDEKWATPADMTAYLKDVQTMRNALKVAEATPTAPEDMAKLTYSEANDIEDILVALDVHITRMLSIVDTGWASGLAYTGFYAKEAY